MGLPSAPSFGVSLPSTACLCGPACVLSCTNFSSAASTDLGARLGSSCCCTSCCCTSFCVSSASLFWSSSIAMSLLLCRDFVLGRLSHSLLYLCLRYVSRYAT